MHAARTMPLKDYSYWWYPTLPSWRSTGKNPRTPDCTSGATLSCEYWLDARLPEYSLLKSGVGIGSLSGCRYSIGPRASLEFVNQLRRAGRGSRTSPGGVRVKSTWSLETSWRG